MNPNRAKLLQMTRQHQQDARIDNRDPKGFSVQGFDCRSGKSITLVQRTSSWAPPKIREVATLVDWIADHPAAKSSRALRQVQDALLESLGIY